MKTAMASRFVYSHPLFRIYTRAYREREEGGRERERYTQTSFLAFSLSRALALSLSLSRSLTLSLARARSLSHTLSLTTIQMRIVPSSAPLQYVKPGENCQSQCPSTFYVSVLVHSLSLSPSYVKPGKNCQSQCPGTFTAQNHHYREYFWEFVPSGVNAT